MAGLRGVGGAPVTIDVDQLHRLALTGPGADAAARAFLVAFLSAHGMENAQAIVAEGAGPDLIRIPDGTPGLLRLSVDAFLHHLEGEIRFQQNALERDRQQDWHQRVGGPDPLGAFLAVVRSDELSAGQLERLGAAAAEARGCAIALVLVGPVVDTPGRAPSRYRPTARTPTTSRRSLAAPPSCTRSARPSPPSCSPSSPAAAVRTSSRTSLRRRSTAMRSRSRSFPSFLRSSLRRRSPRRRPFAPIPGHRVRSSSR